MKILAPLDNTAEVEQLIKAGAGELYCSVLSSEWTQKYSIAAISRRPALICNLKSFDELKTCTEIAHSYHIPVSLAINEHYYIREQYPLLLDYIKDAVNAGVDSFIVSDLALLLLFKEQKIKNRIYISTGGTIFNSESAKFYKELGAAGITLPRHLTIAEIRELLKNISDLETCVFILNSRCPNIDGFCTFMHVQSHEEPYKNACLLPYSVSLLHSQMPDDEICSEEERDIKEISSCVRQQVWQRFHMDDFPCGLCALYEFAEMRIDAVKIVGRGNPIERKIKDIKLIQLLLSLLKDRNISKEKFRERARELYTSNYQRDCRIVMCYYPEVMSNYRAGE